MNTSPLPSSVVTKPWPRAWMRSVPSLAVGAGLREAMAAFSSLGGRALQLARLDRAEAQPGHLLHGALFLEGLECGAHGVLTLPLDSEACTHLHDVQGAPLVLAQYGEDFVEVFVVLVLK